MNMLSIAILSEGSLIDLDGTILVQLGIFLLAFFLLKPLIFRPMIQLFEARDNAIEGARKDARRLREEADDAGKTFDQEMRRVRLTAGEDRERLREEGTRLERSVLDRVRDETNRQLAEADAQLKAEANRMRREIGERVPALAHQIASKFLSREVQ